MNVIGQLADKAHVVKTLAVTGVVRPGRPDRIARALAALHRWGPTPAAGYAASAARYPHEIAIADELGTLTFSDMHARSNALARAWADRGLREGDAVAVLVRNHRGFVDAVIACSKLGCHALFLNTMFAGPQITAVCEREQPAAIVYDEEFAAVVRDAREGRQGYVAWSDAADTGAGGDPRLEDLIAVTDTGNLTPPAEKGRVVILTSGTTGTPKGANRRQPESLEPAAALLRKIPLRARETTHIAAPMFHSWGFAHFTLGMSLSSTLVLRRRFDAEEMLRAVAVHRATALAVVPVMLQRALELDAATLARHDTSSLKIIAASGSALPGDLATRTMDRFGDVLYNLYGSTEVAWATIAQPQDMRAAPGTAGTPPRGTIVRLYDDGGAPVPPGTTGRIFVGNELMFDGYTGGGGKERIDGLMSTGDVGHLDAQGRLFVDGRDDEMIVSGGENLFPREVEDLLTTHEAVEEAAALGVDDDHFGQRLRAFVALRDGRTATEDDLKAYVRANLASFKVPREIVFLDALPRNATGKILKRELKLLP